ncbi:MAG: 2OG-Fe(II) oxygenase [Bdellovibrionales bacterium]|nr:2OG-Fe(II) oxygenase [Bdellovibrionales bacterium]
MSSLVLKQPELFAYGYSLQKFPVNVEVRDWVVQENWDAIYAYFGKLAEPGGTIANLLREFCDFSAIELMLSIRDAGNDWEEDGIWHDDGSRVFAFSLSLTPDPSELDGGQVELRRKSAEESLFVPTPEFGTAICFLTGKWGYEHRTRRVLHGKRVVLVGWCKQ